MNERLGTTCTRGLLILAALCVGLAAAPSFGEVSVAAPGPCASPLGVELDAQAQADRVLRSGLAAAIAGANGSPTRRLDPTDVAAAPPSGGPAAPPAPGFPGVGPCDDPGSGCQGPLVPAALPPASTPPPAPPVVVVPPPTSPCGAPGFPCR